MAPPNSKRPITFENGKKRNIIDEIDRLVPFDREKKNDYLVFSYTIPIEDEEFETDVVQRCGAGRQIEYERFVKYRIECPFLDVCLLFGHSLSVVYQVDFDIRIFFNSKKYDFLKYIFLWQKIEKIETLPANPVMSMRGMLRAFKMTAVSLDACGW